MTTASDAAGPRSISTLLVANRGEIARRVMRTARRMGMRTVAVHSDPDADAPFVHDADLAVRIGGRTATQSYLDGDAILAAARRTGADAIHPGYGFLAENPAFARAVADAGLVWVGPTPESMAAMALKVQAKRLVAAAGVPLVPGAELAADAADGDVLAAGEAVGFPLLVKASAGGGGTGMRLVRDRAGLVEAVSGARTEAASSFGDPTVFLERYLERGRHVEVQVFGDSHGRVVHLFERECSIQRRHQKVIEESPSPGATPATLEQMYAAAVAAARAIGYVGAGTVEFMVVGSGPEQRFHFLEMNTRLQVEHPITEEVTGLDLVEWQLRVARGEPLPLEQGQVTRRGHAIEARLYAEDPARGYLPGVGRLALFDVPPGMRVESGVATGSEVSPYYDSMLAKLVVHAGTRAQAAQALADGLAGVRIAGVATNRESLEAILRAPSFLAGDTTTAFLDEHPEAVAPVLPGDVLAAHVAAAALGLAELERAGRSWATLAPAGWRNVRAVAEVRRFGFADAGVDRIVEVRYLRGRTGAVAVDLVVDGGEGPEGRLPRSVEVARADRVPGAAAGGEAGRGAAGPGDGASVAMRVEVAGVSAEYGVTRAGQWVVVSAGGRATTFQVLPRHPEATAHGHDHGLATPVPGTVTRVEVDPGARVERGDTLVVIEAMKMEHRIRADSDGIVTEVRVTVGESVDAHHVVAVIEEP